MPYTAYRKRLHEVANMTDDMTVRDYALQRKWDNFDDEEEQQRGPRDDVLRREGAHRAYQDVIHFLDGAYMIDYLESVAARIERRRLTGPRRQGFGQ